MTGGRVLTAGGPLLLLLLGRSAAPTVSFTDITRESGLLFRHENSPTTQKYLIETMGGGVALLDYDNDGWLDVFFANGAALQDPMPKGALPDKTGPRFWNRLFRNGGGGTFHDVTERAGLAGSHGYGMGVAVGDYDNDGWPDLYVTNYGANLLYHNAAGHFVDVTAAAGVAGAGWSTSAGFLDYDNDGRLDLFVCRYVDFRLDSDVYCGARRPGYREYCHPRNFARVSNLVFRNNGDGTFTDASLQTGVAGLPGKALGVAFADYDADGRLDVFVANDSEPGLLLRADGKGRFENTALAAGVAFNAEGLAIAGMGTDFADYDNDGRPDLFVTALSGETYALYRNRGDGAFEYASDSAGLSQVTLNVSGWGARLFDYDNDGWKDLFVAQGHVLDTIELTSDHVKYRQQPLLLHGRGGRFVEAGPGAGMSRQNAWAGRGAAFGDLDNDGDIDIVVSNCGEEAYVLRNDGGNRGNWLALRLEGRRSNRDGIGCEVRTRTPSGLVQHHTVSTASSYLSASDKRLLIGLGADEVATLVEVRWPSGVVQRLENVRARQQLRLREPES